MEIKYIKGDVTNPFGKGIKIIPHCCNTLGKMGAGVALSLLKKWPKTRSAYIDWHSLKKDFDLGQVQFVQVEPWIHIANMIGQQGIGTGSKGPPIRYEAIKSCLEKVAMKAKELNASIHMPRIGCGLAGGDWSKIEEIIKEIFENTSIEIFVYDKD